MKTYDTKAGTFGSSPTLSSLRSTIRRWLDRERELISLRNAVGMMSEARRADAQEYDDMRMALSRVKQDSRRLRFITADHAHPWTRERVTQILSSLRTRSYSGACIDIDAAMAELDQTPEHHHV